MWWKWTITSEAGVMFMSKGAFNTLDFAIRNAMQLTLERNIKLREVHFYQAKD